MLVLVISNYSFSLVNLRGELIKTIIEYGHEVIAVAPDNEFAAQVRKLGAGYRTIPLNGTGLNPFKDLVTLLSLIKIMRSIKPDLVFSYTIKPVLYCSLTAWITGTENICSLFPGLGYIFTERRNLKHQLLNLFTKIILRVALSKNKVVFFQNPDDLNLFFKNKLLKEGTQAIVVHGSGVDLEKFFYVPPPDDPISFLLIARLLWDKGIGEYVEAARLLRTIYPKAKFKLLGPFDSNPAAISPGQINRWVKEGVVEYLGETDDVRPHLAETSIYVLPSAYREGTPRSVLEAMAVGRPIITTDVPGCRETVRNGVNGFLIPPKDSHALARAMEKFIKEPRLIEKMGLKSREYASKKYNVHEVNQVMLEAMGLRREGR